MSGFWRSPYIGAVEAFGRCADKAVVREIQITGIAAF
jgi:hypothetical protein